MTHFLHHHRPKLQRALFAEPNGSGRLIILAADKPTDDGTFDKSNAEVDKSTRPLASLLLASREPAKRETGAALCAKLGRDC